MNTYLFRKLQVAVVVLLASAGLMSSCEKEDDGDITDNIVVEAVYIHNKTSTTKVIEKARLGTMIRIEGTGLATTKEIYCNGYPATINLNYITPTSVIFRIPSKAPAGEECEQSVRNTIRVVTGKDDYTFEFQIQDQAPSVSRVSHTLPNPGEVITIYGSRLKDITEIVFPGEVSVTGDGNIEQDEKGEYVRVKIPEGIDDKGGAITVVSSNGIAYSRNYFNRRKFIMNSKFYSEASDDFQKQYSPYCADCKSGAHGYYGWGAPAKDLTAVIPASGNGPKNTDNAKWGATYGSIPAEPGKIGALTSSDNAADNGAGRAVFNGCACYARVIGQTKDLGAEAVTTATPLSKLAIQFDVYVPGKWSQGRIAFVAVDGGSKYMSSYTPWLVTTSSGKEVKAVEMTGWETVTLPLDTFPAFAGETVNYLFKAASSGTYTFQAFITFYNDAIAGAPAPTEIGNFIFYFQNLRMVPYEQPEVPEEEEE